MRDEEHELAKPSCSRHGKKAEALRLRRPEVTIHDLPDDMQEIEALDFS